MQKQNILHQKPLGLKSTNINSMDDKRYLKFLNQISRQIVSKVENFESD